MTQQTMAASADAGDPSDSAVPTLLAPRIDGPTAATSTAAATAATGKGGFSPPTPPSDRVVATLMNHWAEKAFPGEEVRTAFVKDEFEGRLWAYRRASRAWRAAQVAIWALIAVLGLLITIFAGYTTGHGFTIVAGALIAMLTTFSNSTHPSQKADGYGNARLGLRDEGWALLNRTGDYADLKDHDQAYEHFADTVSKIVATKRRNTTLEGLAPAG